MGRPRSDAGADDAGGERSAWGHGPGAFALALPGQALLVALSAMAWGYVKDDAWISFRYAYNLVHGEGMVFNPGERIEGYTNFLWTVLLAPLMVTGLDPLPYAALLGIGFTAGAVVATVDMVRRLGGPGSAPSGPVWPTSRG